MTPPRDTRLASARRSGAWGSGLDFCFDLRGKLEPWPILAMLGWQLLYKAWGSRLDSCFNLRQNLEPWPPLAMLDWQQEEGLGFGVSNLDFYLYLRQDLDSGPLLATRGWHLQEGAGLGALVWTFALI